MAASTRTVRIILTGDSAGMVRAFSAAGIAAEKTQGKFEKMQAVGRGMSSVGRSMTMLAVPLVALGAYAVKSAASFGQAMTRISTQTSMNAKSAAGIASNFAKLSGQVGFNSTQLAEGLYPIASEGLKGTKALQALTAAAKGAKIGGDSLTVTADALSGALGTGAKDIHSASEAMVVMDRTVGAGKMHLQDLTAAMGTGVVQEAVAMGLGFRDVGAALATMTRQGVPAEVEASRLKLSLTKMAAPSGAALKAVTSLGLGQFTLANDLHKPNGLVVALGDLRSHLKGLSTDQQNLDLSAMFGQSRGLSNIVGLLHGLPTMAKIRGQLSGATSGQFANRWAEQAKTPAQKFADTMAVVKTSITQLGTALMPIVLAVLPRLTKDITALVGWVSHLPKPVLDVVIGFTAFLAIGGPILMFFGGLITAIGTVGRAMEAMKLVTLATSTVMKASLIGLVVFALIEMVTHFQQVKLYATEVFQSIGMTIKLFGALLGKIFSGIYNVITWPFRKAFQFIKAGLHAITSLPGSIAHGAGSILNTATFGLLHSGGPVRTHYDTGGPVGSDTIPGWLTPGEFVLNKATTARIGMPALQRMNDGGGMGGQNFTITPSTVIVEMDGRKVGQGILRWALNKQARGPTSLSGGGLMTGSATA
jgi:TP901 family phage tail tape measure protein